MSNIKIKILFLLFISSVNGIFGQFILPRPNTIFIIEDVNKTYLLGENITDSIALTVNRASKYVDSIDTSSNISNVFCSNDSLVVYGDTSYIIFTPNTSTVGSETATITLNNNKVANINYNVIESDTLKVVETLASNTDLKLLDFGTISSYTEKTFYLKNNSSYMMDINSYTDMYPFAQVLNASDWWVDANSTGMVTMSFNPSANGTYTARMLIRYHKGENLSILDTTYLNLKVVVSGYNSSINLLAQTPIDFGTISSNTLKTVTLTNNNSTAITILDYANTNSNNFIISDKKYTVNANSTTLFSVTCIPTANGTLVDTISIIHNGSNSPTLIVLNATISGYVEPSVNEIEFVVASDESNANMKYVGFVDLISQTPGLRIYYTTDGSTPDNTDNEYYMPIELNATTTLKAIGYRINGTTTDVFTKSYTFNASKQSTFTVGSTTYIEAEATNNFNGFHARPQYYSVSNGVYMKMPNESVYNDPHLKFTITPSSTGTYNIWTLVSGDGWDACKFGININGGATYEISSDGVLSNENNWNWKWVKAISSVSMTSGSNYLIDIFDRWSPVHIDKILVTSNLSFIPPQFDIITPNGHERFLQNQNVNITWRKVGDCTNVKLEYSLDNGSNWVTITSSTTNNGAYTWNVGSTLTDKGLIRITGISDSGIPVERSDYGFNITDSASYNPFANDLTFALPVQSYTDRVGTYKIADRPDRTTYLAQINSKALETPWYFGFKDANLLDYVGTVDAEAASTFRAHNTISILHALGNIRSLYTWEGWIGNTDNFASNWWLRTTTSSAPIYAVGEGRRTAYFHASGYDDWVVDRHIAHLAAGFNGIQYDSFDFEVGSSQNGTKDGKWRDANNNVVEVLDYETNSFYTDKNYMKHFHQLLYSVNRKMEVYAGKKFPIAYYNTASRPSTYWELRHNMFFKFYAYESFLGITIDDGLSQTQVQSSHLGWCERGDVELNADFISLLLNNNIGIMVENYGYVHGDQYVYGTTTYPYFNQTPNSGLKYQFAMMLMGYHPEAKFSQSMFWTPGESWAGYANLQKARFVPLGKFKRVANGVIRRDFTDAIVYVNGGTSTQSFNLGDNYYYLNDDGTWSSLTVSSFSIAPGNGLIFVKNKIFTGGSLPGTVTPPPPDTTTAACTPPSGDLYISGRGCFETGAGTWQSASGNWTFSQSTNWKNNGTYSLKALNNGSGGTFSHWLSSVGDLTGYLTPGNSYTLKFTGKTNTGTCSFMVRGGSTSATLSTETNLTTTPTEYTITFTCENAAYDYFYWGYSRSGTTEVYIDDISIVAN